MKYSETNWNFSFLQDNNHFSKTKNITSSEKQNSVYNQSICYNICKPSERYFFYCEEEDSKYHYMEINIVMNNIKSMGECVKHTKEEIHKTHSPACFLKKIIPNCKTPQNSV